MPAPRLLANVTPRRVLAALLVSPLLATAGVFLLAPACVGGGGTGETLGPVANTLAAAPDCGGGGGSGDY